ncbi:MAG: hypothetical protein LWW77_08745 [Propionibacteriales bacterium]|nr:hypothetical protein [Propionibacteriales bacterium]
MRLQSAITAADPDGFARQFADAQQAAAWYSGLSIAPAGITGDQPLIVTTRYPGDRRTATEAISVEQSDGVIASVADQAERPLWTLEKVDLTPAAHGSVLSSGLSVEQRHAWATRLDRAAAAVSSAKVLPAGSTWDEGLVVIVPSTRQLFATVTGANDADTAAVTTCASGTPRIVINPAAEAQGDQWVQATLTHEAVHVATDSACTSGLGWVVEGLAESVTAAADSSVARTNASLVADELAQHGLPTALPSVVNTPTDYALAQFAVDQVRAHRTTDAADFLERGVQNRLSSQEVAQATAWYLAGLRALR